MATSDGAVADAFTGLLVGTAVGDALGLPREGIGPRRANRLFGGAPLQHCLVLGRGMVSDDTEHLRMTAQALLYQPVNSTDFARRLASKLRWWLLALPAGTGMATARSIVRLWLGWPCDRSGVYSAGNGPAMRAGVLGLCLHRDGDPLREFVRASTRITHTDPKAETGAMLVALAVREAYRARGSPVDAEAFLQICRQQSLEPEWLAAIEHLQQSLAASESAAEFAARLNCRRGITGYIVHTVAAVLFCWLRWPGEFRRPMEEIILLGGDSDSTAAILGGLAGASCGTQSIPPEWISHLAEWPYSLEWMAAVLGPDLQRRFGSDQPATPVLVRQEAPTPLPRFLMPLAVLVRNVFFLAVVLFHGFRRLLPPY